jgi:hypothetical protein
MSADLHRRLDHPAERASRPFLSGFKGSCPPTSLRVSGKMVMGYR